MIMITQPVTVLNTVCSLLRQHTHTKEEEKGKSLLFVPVFVRFGPFALAFSFEAVANFPRLYYAPLLTPTVARWQ